MLGELRRVAAGWAGLGFAGQCGARRGQFWRGLARQAGPGKFRPGLATQVMARQAWFVGSGPGGASAGQGTASSG